MEIQIKTLKELRDFAQNFHKALGEQNTVIALTGNLGAGKTTFSKFFLHAAGIKKKVLSPTFVLMIPYKKSAVRNKNAKSKIAKTFFHLDLYRTKNFREVQALGIEELWNERRKSARQDRTQNIFLIEWAEKIRKHLPAKSIFLEFKVRGTERFIKIKNAPKNLKKMLK